MDFGNFAEWITAGATVLLAVGALFQIRLYRKDAKERNALDVVNQLQTNPVLHEITVLLSEKIQEEDGTYDFSKLRKKDRFYVTRLLAAYESMAHSVRRGTIEESFMKEEFRRSVLQLVDAFLPIKGKSAKAKIYTEKEASESFPCLISLYEKWEKGKTE